MHVAEIKEERVETPRDVVQEGQEVEVKVIDINTQDRKVALSMKALLHEGEDDYREYLRRQAEGSKAHLGDVMANKLRKELGAAAHPEHQRAAPAHLERKASPS